MSEQVKLPNWTKFFIAGAAGATGWFPVHPFDVLKVRCQINEQAAKSRSITVFKNIIKEEGFKGLYGGLSAALTRQCTYTTLRLGLYDVLREKIAPGAHDSKHLPLWKKMICGLGSGGIAASVCCPVEVSLVRMQADGSQPIEARRGYKHVFDAFYRIATEEGVGTLYRGVGPTVARGMVVSMSQLATYDHAKHLLSSNFPVMLAEEKVQCHLSASLISGFIYCAASLPLDICKTRMQNQRPDVNGALPYRSIAQALVKIPANEGILALWKGFGPYFCRGGGHTIGMFVFVEQYRKMFKDYYAKNN